MTVSPLERLPPELFATILDELSLNDQKNLSRTNSTIRATTAPAVFRSLKADCPLPEGHIGEAVVKKFGHHVLRLHVYVTFFPNKVKDEEEEPDTESEEEEMSVDEDGGEKEDEQEEDGEDEDKVEDEEDEDYKKLKMACLPNMFSPPSTKDTAEEADGEEKGNEGQEANDDDDEEGEEEEEEEEQEKWYWTNPPESVWARKATDAKFVQDLIQFKGLPRCTILGLHTDGDDDFEVFGDWDDNDIGNDSIYFCCEPENWEEVKTKEEKYAWRAALRDMYHDVATSKVEDLRIYNFLPRKASSWQTTKWEKFLGRLRSLRLYPYGGDNGAGWQVNTLPGFNAFFDELSATVFRYAEALQYLKIVGNEDGFLDCDSLRLSAGIMPELRVLHVEYMAAPSILIHFLAQEPPALEEIHIVNCIAQDMSRDGDTQPTWAQLWKTLRQMSIRVVYKQANTAPLTYDEDFHEGDEKWVPPDDEEENVKQSRKKLKDDPSLVVWPYGGPDDKYGNLSMDVEMDLENFEKGEDNREYALLLADMQPERQEALTRQAWWRLATK